MVGADALAVCRAHQGLPVVFLLLRYSVLFTNVLLSPFLFYLLLISWFICSGRWCIDKLGSLMQTKYHVSWSISELRVRLAPWNRLKPSSKIFYWPFQGGTSFVDLLCFFCLIFVLPLCTSVYLCLVTVQSPVGKMLTSWLSFVVYNFEFVTFPLVSCVRCGTWLHRFQIFTPLLTLFPHKIVHFITTCILRNKFQLRSQSICETQCCCLLARTVFQLWSTFLGFNMSGHVLYLTNLEKGIICETS